MSVEDRMISEYIEYARDVAKKFGERLIAGNIPTPFFKYGGYIIMNPFRVHRTVIALKVDWREEIFHAVLHEHLHNKFGELYPQEKLATDHAKAIIRLLFADTHRGMIISTIPVDLYIDWILVKNVYPEHYESHTRFVSMGSEFAYNNVARIIARLVVSEVKPEVLGEIRVYYTALLAFLAYQSNRVDDGRKVIKSNFPDEYVKLYDEVVGILDSIKDVGTLVDAYTRYIDLLIGFLE